MNRIVGTAALLLASQHAWSTDCESYGLEASRVVQRAVAVVAELSPSLAVDLGDPRVACVVTKQGILYVFVGFPTIHSDGSFSVIFEKTDTHLLFNESGDSIRSAQSELERFLACEGASCDFRNEP